MRCCRGWERPRPTASPRPRATQSTSRLSMSWGRLSRSSTARTQVLAFWSRGNRCERAQGHHESLWDGGQKAGRAGHLRWARQGTQRGHELQWVLIHHDLTNGKDLLIQGPRDSKEEILKIFKLFDEDNLNKITFKNLKRIANEVGEKIPDD